MKRKAQIIKSSEDGKRHIAIDAENWQAILDFLQADKKLTKKFELICKQILSGIRNRDLYDKENINKQCKNVTAMKFKGGNNPRIYCQEVKTKNKTLIVVSSELHESKKNQKNQHKEKNLIKKVASYEYEIE